MVSLWETIKGFALAWKRKEAHAFQIEDLNSEALDCNPKGYHDCNPSGYHGFPKGNN
jgi:hypothetical protein